MTTIYGRSGLPDWQAGTLSVTAGSTAVTITGGGLTSVDPSTGATLWVAGRGDFVTVQGVGAKPISSVNSATSITLIEPWPYATQTNVAYAIIRYALPATGNVAKAVSDFQNTGSDTLPDVSRTIDDSTARVKIKLLAGVPTLAVGPSGTADASLKAALQASTAGVISFPNGATPASDWNSNRCINSGFDVWQLGTSFSIVSGSAYTADQWLLQNTATTATVAVTQVNSVAGISSPNAINIQASAVAVNGYITLFQRFEGAALADIDGGTYTVSFDIVATTTAGTLTNTVIVYANNALDNKGYANLKGNVAYTGNSGRYSVTMTAVQSAGLSLGAQIGLRFQKAGAAGDVNITIGGVMIESGSVASAGWAPKHPALVQLECQRYLQVSWPNLKTATTAPYPYSVSAPAVAVANGTSFPIPIDFDPPMRASPTITLYDTAGTVGKVTVNGTANNTASVVGCSTFMSAMTNSSGAAIPAGANISFQYMADARL